MSKKDTEKSTHKPQADAAPASITMQDKIDIQRLQHHANGERLQRMRGFDLRFTDIVDYIIRITHEIWEEKAIGTLYDYYANTIQIHTSTETVYGREAVIAATIASMASYPDRRLFGDDVIWDGNDTEGFYTSNRITHTGTNTGWTLYGPPTGKQVRYKAVANCLAKENVIFEEWLVRDELTLVHQLGLDPVETAKDMARKDIERGVPYPIPSDVERGIGQLPPSPVPEKADGSFDPEHFITSMIHEVWNWRLLNKVRDYYAGTATIESASMRKMHGHNDYQAYVLSLLAPFPNLAVAVEHFCAIGSEADGYRTATRWRMRGTHTGYGIYGEPTGRQIQIMGVSHHLVKDGKIQAEWSLFDEFALLKQIHAPD